MRVVSRDTFWLISALVGLVAVSVYTRRAVQLSSQASIRQQSEHPPNRSDNLSSVERRIQSGSLLPSGRHAQPYQEQGHHPDDWDDPSLDPAMKRQPPTPILPPSARPEEPAIEPPEPEWRRLRRQEEAIAY